MLRNYADEKQTNCSQINGHGRGGHHPRERMTSSKAKIGWWHGVRMDMQVESV